MSKIIILVATLLFYPIYALADCFIAKENDHVIEQNGECKTRHSPCSTFKIAISLMGFSEKILFDENNPELPFKQGYADWLEKWKQPHTPTLWIKNSCVWYSQIITKEIGINKFKEYLSSFDYGNKDASGDKGKNNGLTHSWLSSSLKISPGEQIVFLQKLILNQLPVSLEAQQMTRNILFAEDLIDRWKFYGRTGMGYQIDKNGNKNRNKPFGWFVGWAQKNDETIVFANYIEDDRKQDIYPSIRAKAGAKEKLLKIIENRLK